MDHLCILGASDHELEFLEYGRTITVDGERKNLTFQDFEDDYRGGRE